MKYLLLTIALLASVALILTSALGVYLLASLFLGPFASMIVMLFVVMVGTMSLSVLS